MLLLVVLFFGVACSAPPTSKDGGISTFATCSKTCPRSRQDAVMQQITGVFQKQCSPNVTEEQRQTFWQSQDDLYERLTARASRCEDGAPEDDEARCRNVASCVLGSALDELKADYPKDVVTAIAASRKLWSMQSLKNHASPPEACDFLYEPYKA